MAGHRLREIAAWWRDSADQRDRATPSAQCLDTARAFVDCGEPAAEIGRIAFLHRHVTKSPGDLAQCLGPARSRIGEHDHIVALVTEIFGHRHADIDRGLAGDHRHVRGVGDQQRALHHAAPGIRVLQLRKALEHVDQFVAAFTTTDVDHDIRIGPACHLLLHHRLAGAKRAGHGTLAALEQREEGIEDALPGDQRLDAMITPGIRPCLAHWPAVIEGQFVHLALCITYACDRAVERVAAGGREVDQLAADCRRHQDAMLDGLGFLHCSQARARCDLPARLQAVGWAERPGALAVERMDAQPARDIVAGDAGDLLQRTLHAIENTLQQAGAELDCQRVAQTVHGLTGTQSIGRFVGLHDRIVTFQGNDLADDVEAADAHLLAIAPARQVDAQNRTVDLADVTTA